ncbi:ArsR/SmtB family transcription factor [Zoogloea sp.]|uniref:ArsR/SmtB family transcription factor n=1 Tax=Zoogloea sp. TaxID=49181 RepID=UPI001B764222|nr:winged helix-turn-helix transcriptional regulator [Zoogloea sp.]
MNNDYSRAIPETWRDIAAVFTALGDEHRQRILLTFESGEKLNVGQIAEVSTLARSTVSHHLKVLREARVLISEREGKEIYFRVNKSFLQDAFGKVSAYLDTYL